LESAEAEAEKLFADVAQWKARAVLLQRDLTAARAAEARAVELLRGAVEELKKDLKEMNPKEYADRGKVEPGYCEALKDMSDGLAYRLSELNTTSAIDWLAQQRREAAKQAMEDTCQK
jgi:thiamine monophosphate kinase